MYNDFIEAEEEFEEEAEMYEDDFDDEEDFDDDDDFNDEEDFEEDEGPYVIVYDYEDDNDSCHGIEKRFDDLEEARDFVNQLIADPCCIHIDIC